MTNHNAELIVVSTRVSLDRIEVVLGKSGVGGCTIGSVRDTGLARKHSMWRRKFSSDAELLVDVVDEILGWLEARLAGLKAADPDASCKISCSIYADGDRDSFAVNPQTAKKLADVDVLLLLQVYATESEDESLRGSMPGSQN